MFRQAMPQQAMHPAGHAPRRPCTPQATPQQAMHPAGHASSMSCTWEAGHAPAGHTPACHASSRRCTPQATPHQAMHPAGHALGMPCTWEATPKHDRPQQATPQQAKKLYFLFAGLFPVMRHIGCSFFQVLNFLKYSQVQELFSKRQKMGNNYNTTATNKQF